MKNPIKTLNNKGITYEQMAKLTGLHINTIYNIANYTPKQCGNMTVFNVILIKEKLKIDLWKYFKQ